MSTQCMDVKIFEEMELREGDVFISTGIKQGTTWNCYIVQQLLSNCQNDFRFLAEEVPWAEFVYYPGQPMEERLKILADKPRGSRRALKSHSAPPALPLDPKVKYIVCVRNPFDAVVSRFHFMLARTDEFCKLWQSLPPYSNWEEFKVFASKSDVYWDFVNAWWPHRGGKNVFMVHYSALKNNPEETIRKMAEFLEVPISDAQLQQVVHNSSFENMKRDEEKFEGFGVGKNRDIQVITHGGMMRKGQVLQGKEAPEDFIEAYAKLCQSRCLSQEQLAWCENGGPMPV
eukprot:Phypoly_transcript_14199.p1 GENE.Phypoly_transcript_14199~~Phypoly_transcript_14199.p1  ORF type:complete len:287 (+),score=38.05 Phypoly_transcript_14199:120-980(+)